MPINLPLRPVRYTMRNGGKVIIDSISNAKASDGSIVAHAWGTEIATGNSLFWDADTGKRMPSNAPGAKAQDIVRRGR